MWKLDCEEGWVLKNWCFWNVALEKTLESPLDSKGIKSVNPKENQPWIFIRRTDSAAEAPIFWSQDSKSRLIRESPDAGKEWSQEEKGTTEDEIAGWQHRPDRREFEWTLELVMDREAWRAVIHGVTKSQTWLSDFTFTFHFPALEKEMAIHSSVLAWRIPGTGEPGGLPSMGSHRVGHDWSDSAAAAAAAAAAGLFQPYYFMRPTFNQVKRVQVYILSPTR